MLSYLYVFKKKTRVSNYLYLNLIKVLALWDITIPILDSEKLFKTNSQTDCSFDTKLH